MPKPKHRTQVLQRKHSPRRKLPSKPNHRSGKVLRNLCLSAKRWISIDTETTGVDLHHGARPFLVTVADQDGAVSWWEWDVDPKTRRVIVDPADLCEIQEEINQAELCVLQNTKFDYSMLKAIFQDNGMELEWDWLKTVDTLFADHMLNSVQPHDLTSMVLRYLGTNLQPYEDKIRDVVLELRRRCTKTIEDEEEYLFKDWVLAKSDLECMPSAKSKVWKLDMWLPRVVARTERLPTRHPYQTICSDYANSDSIATVMLWRYLAEKIEERQLWDIYNERLRLLPVIPQMEEWGVTVNQSNLSELTAQYEEESVKSGDRCVRIAKRMNYDLVLPKSGNNNSLLHFLFDSEKTKAVLPLPIVSRTKSGNPSLDKEAMSAYEEVLPPKSKELLFVRALKDKRKRDTACSYMDSYQKFWVPTEHEQFFRLHPSLNPTGTNTLRGSSSNPNEQNISKQDGFNLRYAFGPTPGRCWASMDYENVELRIPAYESQEQVMIELFEKPDEAPYFGSYHLLNASIVYPEKFWPLSETKGAFKDKYKATYYQWVKNGGFAIQYGCQEAKADTTFRVPGAYNELKKKMPKIAALNDHYIRMANTYGIVETIPDKEVDPEKGYPVACSRTPYGTISPTIPLNYHIQSTAMWIIWRAMVKVSEYFETLEDDWKLIMQVHDEVVIDFPLDCDYEPVLLEVQRIMQDMGQNVGIPLRVGIDIHPDNWGTSISMKELKYLTTTGAV